jgi:hypothetical protein
MNPPGVTPYAPSAKPALELIALARLSPPLACQRLRALLLVNPDYFGNVPSSSFNTVLHIQEDTTYESLSLVSYDPLRQQLSAAITVKQPNGYSDNVLNNGSEEFVRFYLSYDGGVRWLDQGMRFVDVFDASTSKPRNYEVTQQIIPLEEFPPEILPKVRAILSWNLRPPTLAPDWRPVWGNVVESSIRMKDARVIFSGRLRSLAYVELRGTSEQGMLNPKQSMKRAVAVCEDQSQLDSTRLSKQTRQNRFADAARLVLRTLKSLMRESPSPPEQNRHSSPNTHSES